MKTPVVAIILTVIGVAQAGGIGFYLKKNLSGQGRKTALNRRRREHEIETKQSVVSELQSLQANLLPFGVLREEVQALRLAREQLRAEQGRSSITRAELETLESRLRELDEIERELEASSLETEEEMKIVSKKENDLRRKNDELNEKLMTAVSQLDANLNDLPLPPEMKEKLEAMRTQATGTQEQVMNLAMKIDEGNKEYFQLKTRYDALDIEYAQLYEKFSQEEQSGGS